jgi:iron complex outermembrane receptor protein
LTLNHHDFSLGGLLYYFRILVSFICFSLYSSLIYSESLNTDEVIVYSNKFYTTERNSSHHSEIYDHKEIINSGYTNLFDFLSNKSSLNITSYSGNKGAPLIDMRGYGLESGYQNIVINIDGYRMNSIDSSSSFLGTLSTNDIDRIEILKGSGSVVHGDGSNAGSINIYTKNHKKTRISSSFGNFGGKKHSFSTGQNFNKFDISFSSNYESNDGFSTKDNNGNKDKSKSSNQSLKIKVNPNEYSQINFKYLNNESNALFPGSLTRQQFKRDPSQRPTYGGYSRGYDEFDYNDDLWSLDYITHLSDNLSLKVYHQGEHKKYAPRDYTPNNLYITKANVNGLELDYSQDTFTITSGISVDERERTVYSTSNLNVNQIKKQRDSIFFQVNHYLDQPKKLSLNYGARSEKQITKINNQNIDKDDSDRLSMFEVGLNYLANEKINIFTNYTKSMQSQDIDRIFPYRNSSSASNKYDSFNSFIKPMDVRTINFGVNYNDGIQKIKQSIFYSDIDNEIVFNPNNTSFDSWGTNENIDRTRKYGYEIFVYRKINNLLDLKFNYSYTRAQIINDTSSTFPSGKNLPGVPKNSVNFSINFTKDNFLASLNHFWRDRSFVLNDFDNNSSQLAPSFESTDLYLKYKLPIENIYLSSVNLFANVNNIFKQKNGIQSYDDTIYPFNFRRTWFIGMEIEL